MKSKNEPITTRTFAGMEVLLQSDELGTLPNGDRVSAITDAAGSQIVVKGGSTHLLSRPFKNHDMACATGTEILRQGSTDVYDGWTDMNKGSLGAQLFAIFAGPFR